MSKPEALAGKTQREHAAICLSHCLLADTGADWTNPDLTHQIDYGRSVSCVGGVANASRAAWKDTDGHGTW